MHLERKLSCFESSRSSASEKNDLSIQMWIRASEILVLNREVRLVVDLPVFRMRFLIRLVYVFVYTLVMMFNCIERQCVGWLV